MGRLILHFCTQVPDATALLDFLEVLELPQFIAVIYLSSVVKQVCRTPIDSTVEEIVFTFQKLRCFAGSGAMQP